MTIVIGLPPHERGDAAARIGVMLAAAGGEDLLVVVVAPNPWPSTAPLDDEYRAAQEKIVNQSLDRAREIIKDQVPVTYIVESARSVATGLIQVAQKHDASTIVLGSSARGVAGVVSLGGVAERILHSLDIPICFAPAGYSGTSNARLTRITVGFGRADHDSGLLASAAARADELHLRVRVACFAVRPAIAHGTIEKSAEGLVVGEWADKVRFDINHSLRSTGFDPNRAETVIGTGLSWGDAIAAIKWDPGDLLIIGASASAVSRFFLGSHASKIVRNSPVPVMILARARSGSGST
jgi:nucleotide-binding universal stress UspA family protein